MSDARWLDVDVDVEAAERHLAQAVAIYERGGFEGDNFDSYVASMALMHSMQSAYTSLEAALLRVLDMIGEERPSGPSWHQDLVRRVGNRLEGRHGRPAILPANTVDDVRELLGFRHRAVHAYEDFNARKAKPAVEAAARLATSFPAAIAEFRHLIDPDEE